MVQESTGHDRRLVALVRADGHGEIRDGESVLRMRADTADELRGIVMERALAIAADAGEPVRVRTVDVDGVYPLVLMPDGGIEQDGEVEPLLAADLALTPETAPEPEPEPEPEEEAWVHETIRLPRLGMMAPMPPTPEGATPLPAGPVAAPAMAPADAAPSSPDEDEDDDADLDEFHDEALDHDFDDLDDLGFEDEDEAEAEDEADEDDAEESAVPEAQEPAEEWSPTFARDPQRARARVGLGGAPERGPGFPELPLFPEAQESEPEPEPAPEPQRVERPAAAERPALKAPADGGPTLDDFFAASATSVKRTAEQGWRAGLRRATGGLIALGPGARERQERAEIDAIQRGFDGSRTIVVVNPKGGAHKTTATLMIAAMFGIHRGGYTLAWDNNETRGTLGWRSKPGRTPNTAVDLLRELPRFEVSGGATISDIDRYVRNQGAEKFDVLASDDDAASAAIIDDDAFSRLHRVLSRFYRVMVIDTGNNMRASNWEAALEVADQLVIVSTAREDTAASAAWLADGLRERGYGDKLANAVTILSSPSEKEDPVLVGKLERHFAQLTRAVVSVPYDHAFVGGGELDVASLQPATRDAWRHATAVIAEGL